MTEWFGLVFATVMPMGWAVYAWIRDRGGSESARRAEVYLDKPHEQPKRGGRHSRPRRR